MIAPICSKVYLNLKFPLLSQIEFVYFSFDRFPLWVIKSFNKQKFETVTGKIINDYSTLTILSQ